MPVNENVNREPPGKVSGEKSTLEGRHMVMTISETENNGLGRGGKASSDNVMCSQHARSTKSGEPRSKKPDVPSTTSRSVESVCNYCKKSGHWKNACPKLQKKLTRIRSSIDPAAVHSKTA